MGMEKSPVSKTIQLNLWFDNKGYKSLNYSFDKTETYHLFFLPRPQEIVTLPERLLIVSNVPKTLEAVKEVETLIQKNGAYKKVLHLNGRVKSFLSCTQSCTSIYLFYSALM